MRPLTDVTPKPLLRVGKLRLIEYHLYALASSGIKDIVVNHAHLGEQITRALGDGSGYGLRIAYSAEPEGALETAGGIVKALPLLNSDPFIVVNGDIWTDYPFDQLPPKPEGLAHIVLVDNPAHHSGGDFLLAGAKVSEIRPDRPGMRLTFSGIGIYRRALFAHLAPGRIPLAPILREAMAREQVTGEHYRGGWIDIGTPERLAELDAELCGSDD
jgi:MurNAc alpha-1-phosphate uridylyltransferase